LKGTVAKLRFLERVWDNPGGVTLGIEYDIPYKTVSEEINQRPLEECSDINCVHKRYFNKDAALQELEKVMKRETQKIIKIMPVELSRKTRGFQRK